MSRKVKNYLENPHLKQLLKGGLSVTLEEEPAAVVEEEDTIIKVEIKDRSIPAHPYHPDNYSEYLRGMSGTRKDQPVLTFKKRIIVH